MFSMDESENGKKNAICCLFISRSLFFFSVFRLFRLLPLLNDEYTLPPPAGKESYCHSCMRSSYVLGSDLRCVPVREVGKYAGESGDATVGVGVGDFSGDWPVYLGLYSTQLIRSPVS